MLSIFYQTTNIVCLKLTLCEIILWKETFPAASPGQGILKTKATLSNTSGVKVTFPSPSLHLLPNFGFIESIM